MQRNSYTIDNTISGLWSSNYNLKDCMYVCVSTIYFFIFLLQILFYFIFFLFKLYKIVLVLPSIKMNPPEVYMCSPSWTLLPPPSPYHPSGSSQCASPKHPVSCIEPGLATHFIHDIIHVSMPFSQIYNLKHFFPSWKVQQLLWIFSHQWVFIIQFFIFLNFPIFY